MATPLTLETPKQAQERREALAEKYLSGQGVSWKTARENVKILLVDAIREGEAHAAQQAEKRCLEIHEEWSARVERLDATVLEMSAMFRATTRQHAALVAAARVYMRHKPREDAWADYTALYEALALENKP